MFPVNQFRRVGFSGHCLENWPVEIELSHLPEITWRKTQPNFAVKSEASCSIRVSPYLARLLPCCSYSTILRPSSQYVRLIMALTERAEYFFVCSRRFATSAKN